MVASARKTKTPALGRSFLTCSTIVSDLAVWLIVTLPLPVAPEPGHADRWNVIAGLAPAGLAAKAGLPSEKVRAPAPSRTASAMDHRFIVFPSLGLRETIQSA